MKFRKGSIFISGLILLDSIVFLWNKNRQKDHLLIKHKMTSITFSLSLFTVHHVSLLPNIRGGIWHTLIGLISSASPLLVSCFTLSACPMRSRPYVLVCNWTWLTWVDRSHVRTRHTRRSPPPHLQIHAELLHQSERCYKASALFCVPWYDNTIKHYDLDSPLLSDHWKTWKDDWSKTINQLIFLDGVHKHIL